jgi:two-component system, sensor histidine kinase
MRRENNARASRRVLIVEDNPDGLEILKLLLEVCGHQVEAAADGQEGLEKGLAWRPEVAVVDIGLPKVDGYAVARRLREALDGGIKLIALTAFSQPEDRQRAVEAGFDHYLTKPADTNALLGLIQPA